MVVLLVFGGIVLACAVGYAIYALRVTAVRVTGARTVSVNAVVRAAGLRGDERILWTKMSRIVRRVERVPGVAGARADRSLPGTVVITVVERTALVRLDSHPGLAADRDGVLFPFGPDDRVPTLAAWRGRAAAGSRLDDSSRIVLGAWPTFPARLRERARSIRIRPSLVVWLDTGTQIRFGALGDLEAKARAAQAVLDAVGGRAAELAYVDVRAPGAPASRKKGVPEVTPGASAAAVPAAPPAPAASTPVPAPAPTSAPAATATPAPTPFTTTLIQ